jgi:hypothetical protein
MKNLYTTLFFVLTATMVYAYSVYAKSTINATPLASEQNGKSNMNFAADDTVWFDRAMTEVTHYLFFQELIPKKCTWNSADSTLDYGSIKITNGEYVNKLNAHQNDASGNDMDFPYQNALASSYFIPIEDIRKALEAVDGNSEVNGFRIFMALRKDTIDPEGKKHNSHTLLTPGKYDKATDIYTDDTLSINGQPFLLDLTTPCPSACPQNEMFPIVNSH